MTDWKREPLLHFLVLGALLVLLASLWGGPGGSGARRTVTVTRDDVARLASAWEARWRRAPTEEELRSLVDGYVREEILYREAVAMGLAEDDPIIRRRLLEKIAFLTEDPMAPVEPSEAEIRAHFAANEDDYRVPERRTFTHVFFSEDERGERAWSDARALLEELREMSPSPERAPELGDRFATQYDYPRRSRSEVARHMGPEFAEELFSLPLDSWQGPLGSAYGVHLVRVLDASDSRALELEAVRQQVRDDLVRRRRERAAENFYEGLRSEYEILVEKGD